MKIFSVLAVLVLFSCNPPQSGSKATLTTPGQALRAVEARDMASLYADNDTITGKANILLVAPGGPVFESPSLNDDVKNNSYARVLVKQEQMIRKQNGQLPTNRTINNAEAREINLYSAAMLFALAKDFKAKGHKVSLYSRSFGSFIVPEMLRHYGDEPFEKIFIAVGRLDMPMDVVNGFANDQPKRFQNGTTVIDSPVNLNDLISQAKNMPGFCNLPNRDPLPDNLKEPATIAKAICTGDSVDAKKEAAFRFKFRSGMRLMANIARNRYTTLLKNRDLSKITYYFGGKDSNVGRLTNAEVQFLTGRAGFDIDSPPSSAATSWYNTNGFTPDGSTVPRTMHTITGASKKATVKYDLMARHFPLLAQTTADIVASF